MLLTVCRSMGSATTFRQLIFISILNFQEEGMPLFWHTLCFCCASYLFSSMVAKAGVDRFSTGVVWWCQSMPEAPWRRRSVSAYFAESTRVLAAEYNSELRKAFGRLQDDNRSLYVGNDFKSLRATYAIGHVLAPERRHPLFRNLPVRRPWKKGCFSVPGRRRTGFVSLSSSFPLRVISL